MDEPGPVPEGWGRATAEAVQLGLAVGLGVLEVDPALQTERDDEAPHPRALGLSDAMEQHVRRHAEWRPGDPPRHVLDVVDVLVAEARGQPPLVECDALPDASPLHG
jgi:hypothetical protein